MSPTKTLKDELYETIHRNKKPLKAIADELDVSENYLTRAALPDQEDSETGTGCRFPLKKLIPLLRCTNDNRVLDYIESAVGRVAYSLPKAGASAKDLYRQAMRATKEFGELIGALEQALADDVLTEEEKLQILKDGYKAMQGQAALLEAVKKA